MRILFVNEKCGFFGGVEQNIADAAAGLTQRGHTCYLAYGEITDRDADAYSGLFEASFRCRELANHAAEDGAAGLTDLARRLQPDTVYLHKLPRLPALHTFPAAVRTVRMVHDHDLCCPRNHKYYAWNGHVCHHRAGWRCFADCAFLKRDTTSRFGIAYSSIGGKLREMRRNYGNDALLVGSRFMRQELLQNGFPQDRVHILAPIVRRVEQAPSPVPDSPRLLYVGQLIHGKGVDLLLKALGMVDSPFLATIVGQGNARHRLEGLCGELGLSHRVEFTGWVDHQDLGTLYRSARAVVVPSRWPEPFGMVGLEAMHHARPVIGFDVGGIPDWLDHEVTGLLVPEQDVAGLAGAVTSLLTDPGRALRMGSAGHEQVQRRFSFEAYLARLETHLDGTA